MTELKACPFCGSEAETDVPPMRREVTCTDCGAFALTVGAWNTRPEEDTLRAYVARLRLALEFYADRDFDGYADRDFDGLSMDIGHIIKDGGDIACAALAYGEADQ
jgi:hypothetical protein